MEKMMQEKQLKLTMLRNERNRVQRRLEGSKERLDKAKKERDRLERQLTKEQQDVLKLGKFSFSNKLNHWTGKWDIQMEKELAEATEAELKFNEAEKHFIDLLAETEQLQKEMNNPEFLYIDEEWSVFLTEKEAWLRHSDSASSHTLQRIADERVSIRSLLREVNEALDAGNTAIRALNKAIDKLGSAEGMSMWDTFLGGGLIVSALKYSEVNQSDDHIHRAQRALRHFGTELKDVQDIEQASFTINQKDIITFTDLFFDNIFSDWMVHNRITEAKRKLNEVLQEVRRICNELGRMRDRLVHELKQLDEEEQKLILS